MKTYISYLIICCASILEVSSQDFVLYPNINPRYHLEQNIENNILHLKAESKITKVSLYNRATKKTSIIKNNTDIARIALNELDVSYYTIMTHTNSGEIIVLGIDLLSKEHMKSLVTKNKIIEQKVKAYWVIKETYKHSGSSLSTYFIHNKKSLEYAIKKNRKDLTSFSGKNNSLIIYEIYNLKGFASRGLKNKLIKSKGNIDDSTISEKQKKAFNIIPLYKSQS